MEKIILIAAMAVMSVAAMAQDFKFGYVDLNELFLLHPDMKKVQAVIEENQKTNEEILMTMYQEYQTKMQQYEKNSATWTQAVREMKEKEIMQLEQNLQQNQQVLYQEGRCAHRLAPAPASAAAWSAPGPRCRPPVLHRR